MAALRLRLRHWADSAAASATGWAGAWAWVWAGGFRPGCSARCSITGATRTTTTPTTAAVTATAATRSSLAAAVRSTTIRSRSIPRAAAPDETVVNQATTVFDSAREAFKGGDYAKALDLVDQALKTTPNDATLHEFRALCLFALERYDEAAAVLYAVLSVGPGWDWTTLISLYGDPETYTQQLRALESYCSQNPQSAAARFVLGYHYLTQGHAEAAVRQFKIVRHSSAQGSAVGAVDPAAPAHRPASGARDPASRGSVGRRTATAAVAANPASTQPAGKLEGTWTAQPSPDTTITVTFR